MSQLGFGTGLAYIMNYRLIVDEGPTNASTVGYLLPVVSVVLGAIFLSEALTGRVIAGMAVVLLGVGMTKWQRRVKPSIPYPDPNVSNSTQLVHEEFQRG